MTARVGLVKRLVVVVSLLASSVAHSQNEPQVTEAMRISESRLGAWNVCQRNFITPLLESQRPVPDIIADAHATCRGEEEALVQALVDAHGIDQARGLMTFFREATDRIMCGLLRAVRMPGDGTMHFNTDEECLRGEVSTSPASRNNG